jgi:hypothetical protein
VVGAEFKGPAFRGLTGTGSTQVEMIWSTPYAGPRQGSTRLGESESPMFPLLSV